MKNLNNIPAESLTDDENEIIDRAEKSVYFKKLRNN